jgi:hypothetical protein
LFDAVLGRLSIQADDDLVSDSCPLLGIELECGLKDLFSGFDIALQCTQR